MAAPSDDFESADYPLLRSCSLESRGLWADMRCLMKNGLRRGYLSQEGKPLTLRQLGMIAGGLSTDQVRPLVQELVDAGVCAFSEIDKTYFSPRIVSFETFRAQCSNAGKKGGGNPDLKKPPPDPKNKGPTYKGSPTFIGSPKVGPKVELSGGEPGSPPDGFPSHSPSLSPSTIQLPTEVGNAGASAGEGSETGKAKSEAKPESKTSDRYERVFPPGIWKRAVDGWFRSWKAAHGTDYTPGGRDFGCLSQILKNLKGDLAELQKVVQAWLKEPETYRAKGHTIAALWDDLNDIRSKIAQGRIGVNGNHRTPNRSATCTIRENLPL